MTGMNTLLPYMKVIEMRNFIESIPVSEDSMTMLSPVFHNLQLSSKRSQNGGKDLHKHYTFMIFSAELK